MALSGRHFWPLFASLGVHTAIATALAVSPRGSQKPVPMVSEIRDVWIGDSLEIAAPSDEPAHGNTASGEKPPVERVAAPRIAVERPVSHARAVRAEPAPDPEMSLAARILAYAPRSGTSASSERDGATTAPARGAPGGIERSDDTVRARGFAKAFTRALPAANTSDPVWGTLPLGPIGVVRVSVVLDDDGAIAEAKVRDEPRRPPPHLARLVDRTLLLLQGGRFALAKTGKGAETLKLEVTLSERPMESGPLALGFESPSPGSPGRAYFQLASGRLVETRVTIEPN